MHPCLAEIATDPSEILRYQPWFCFELKRREGQRTAKRRRNPGPKKSEYPHQVGESCEISTPSPGAGASKFPLPQSTRTTGRLGRAVLRWTLVSGLPLGAWSCQGGRSPIEDAWAAGGATDTLPSPGGPTLSAPSTPTATPTRYGEVLCTPVASSQVPAAPPSVNAGTSLVDGEASSPEQPGRARRMVIIAVDGLGGRYLQDSLADGDLPNFAGLSQLGASTHNARADYTHTVTLPGHTSMLTGRPVTAVEGYPPDVHHGNIGNGWPGPNQTLHNSGNPLLLYVASLFDVAHDHDLKTCLYAGKGKFILYANSYDGLRGAPDTTGNDNGQKKVDHCLILEYATADLVRAAATDLATGVCDVTFFHIAELDLEGHEYGWGSTDWLAELERVDQWIGSLSRVSVGGNSPGPWGFVLTADHGGSGYDHSDATNPDNYQIPFYLVGPGIPPKSDLYDLFSSTRRNPGEGRPSYADPAQPIWNGDAANLALGLLGLPPVPGSFLGGLVIPPGPAQPP